GVVPATGDVTVAAAEAAGTVNDADAVAVTGSVSLSGPMSGPVVALVAGDVLAAPSGSRAKEPVASPAEASAVGVGVTASMVSAESVGAAASVASALAAVARARLPVDVASGKAVEGLSRTATKMTVTRAASKK